MKKRLYRTSAATTLVGAWVFAPVASTLEGATALLWPVAVLGIIAGATAGWVVQYVLHRPITRRPITTLGWASGASLLFFVSGGSLADALAPIKPLLAVSFTGSLAWALRLALPPSPQGTPHRHHPSRRLLVGIRSVLVATDDAQEIGEMPRAARPAAPALPQLTPTRSPSERSNTVE